MSFERQNSASNGFDPSVSFERQNSLGELEWTAQVSLIFKVQLKLFCYNLLFLLSMLPNLVLLVKELLNLKFKVKMPNVAIKKPHAKILNEFNSKGQSSYG